MEIFPAIDLLGGKVVRLFQGDYAQKQEFGDDPAAFAKSFEAAGAKHLHVVDLDGAKTGAPQHFNLIGRIARETSLSIEFGGGVRSAQTVKDLFAAGVHRVILGTVALRDPAFTKEMLARYGAGKVAVGVDAKDGKVAVEGWLAVSETDSLGFCREMAAAGVRHIIYTDISRDGAERGANLEAYRPLGAIKGLNVTAAGGVGSVDDIRALRGMGLYGAILGKALYTGAVELKAALAAAGGTP